MLLIYFFYRDQKNKTIFIGSSGVPRGPPIPIKGGRLQAKSGFNDRLLDWFARNGRHDLPWRGKFDPYPILLSEFMLQQTGVSTVLPYFPRFLKAFPTIRRLAAAPLERVLEQWAGLGYYARARNLQATAKIIVEKCGGRLPRNRAEVLELPGVGPYTAGALLSFTYDLPEPLVDGNVVRVLSRIFGIKGDPRRPAILKKLWEKARSLVPSRGARDFNSALMDFGATVCKPGVPECAVCPMTALCWAYRNNWVDRLPVSRRKGVQPIVTLRAFLVEKDGRVLLRRRPAGGLWGGLWELPMEEGSGAAGVYSVGGRSGSARTKQHINKIIF
jgi:A/G-specific adenine glycosylase